MYVIVTGNCETEGRVYMTNQLVMPLGIDRFDQIRTEGYYYIDKTDMIAELLRKTFQVRYDCGVTAKDISGEFDYPSQTFWKDTGNGYAGTFF